ncbi:hypothetical protein [Haladaptatus sp. CMAA 1911]|uniref:hypothetical protein n=1 Tax=unclassified Haladaptatus TaxID=2622732 RepID=UPI003754F450
MAGFTTSRSLWKESSNVPATTDISEFCWLFPDRNSREEDSESPHPVAVAPRGTSGELKDDVFRKSHQVTATAQHHDSHILPNRFASLIPRAVSTGRLGRPLASPPCQRAPDALTGSG